MDLRECVNENCMTGCDKEQRKTCTIDDICNITKSCYDYLPVRCVGAWAREKIFRLLQYFGIFSRGMSTKWDGLNYVEICSGPGRCILRETGEEIDGTSLAVLNNDSYKYLTNAVFVDYSETVTETLNKRIDNLGYKNAKAFRGDYNSIESLESALKHIDTSLLTLAFIDPTDCSVPFDTIQYLTTKFPNIDIIFNFAYGTDMIRNIKYAIENPASNVRAKYNSFFGNLDYLSEPEVIQIKKSSVESKKLAFAFLSEYKRNLKLIGLKYSAEKNVKNLYWLLYATGHKRGLDFWNKSQRIGPDDQREISFD